MKKHKKRSFSSLWASLLALSIVVAAMMPGNPFRSAGDLSVARAAWYESGGSWVYRKPITIDHTKVANADQADFPLLVSFTDADLKTAANGGYVQSSNGYDIIFTSSDGATKLDHEIEKYDAATGELVAWVRVPILSASVDTVIYAYYDNSSVSTSQENVAGVWGSAPGGVWHLDETGNAASGDYQDSTVNENDSISTTYQPQAATGKIGGAEDFDGASNSIEVGDGSSLDITGTLTISSWIRPDTSSPADDMTVVRKYGDSAENYALIIGGGDDVPAGNIGFVYYNGGWRVFDSGYSLGDASWHFISVVFDYANSGLYFYDNGDLKSTKSVSYDLTTNGSSVFIGRQSSTGSFYFSGLIDELHISGSAYSADRIATEYNNQSDPGTFYSVGTENMEQEMDHFSVTGSVSQVAGGSQALTITAANAGGDTYTPYSGDKTITFSGAGAMGEYVPTCTDKTGADIPFGSATTLTFAEGVANCNLKLYKAETATVAAGDGSYSGTLGVAVSPATVSGFSAVPPDRVFNDVSFLMTVTARDAYGNMTPNVAGDTGLALASGTISPNSIASNLFQGYTGPDSNTYGYEQDVTVTNNVAVGYSGYQVKLTLDTASLVAMGKMQADCDDMRFAESDNTNISYWIESGCNTASTMVWVKTDMAASASKTIYWYYGNPSVGSGSDGSSVFSFFDDFDNQSSLDTASRWTVSGTGSNTVSGGVLTMNGTSSYIVQSKSTFGTGYAVRARLKSAHFNVTTYSEYFNFQNSVSNGLGVLYANVSSGYQGKYYTQTGSSSYSASSIVGWTANTYAVQDIIRGSSSGIFRVNDASQVTLTSPYYTGTDCMVRFRTSTAGSSISADWVLIRQYASTEPASVILSTGSSPYGDSSSGGDFIGNFTISGAVGGANDVLTMTNGSVTGTVDIYVDAMNHFVITGAASQDTGASQVITVTAVGSSGNTYTDYYGDHALTFSGASAIGAYVPTCSDKTGADIPLGTATTLAFTDGIATCNLKLYKAENASIDATDGISSATGHTLAVTAVPQSSRLDIVSITATAGSPYGATVYARDNFGNVAYGYSGDKNVTFSGAGSIGVYMPTASDKTGADIPMGTSATLAFADGIASTDFKFYKSEAFNLSSSDGAISASTPVTVYPSPIDSFDISAPSSVSAGYPFDMTLTAKDVYGNGTADIAATTLSTDRGTISPSSLPSSDFFAYIGPDAEGYAYRRTVSVTNNVATSYTGYQVKLNLDTASIISAGKMQPDCDDMRFAETNNANIPYWIESGCNTSSTIVWVKTNLIASASKNIYWYYGNAAVATAADGNNVFDFFDDFNGDAVDTSKWTVTTATGGTVTQSGGIVALAAPGSNGSTAQLVGGASFGRGTAMRARVKSAHASSQYNEFMQFNNGNDGGIFAAYSWTYPAGSYYSSATPTNNFSYAGITGWVANTYAVQDLIRNAASPGAIFRINDGSQQTILTNIYTGTDTKPRFLARTYNGALVGSSVSVDWVMVRKYASTEPTVSVPSDAPFFSSATYFGAFTLADIVAAGDVVITATNGSVSDSVTVSVDAMNHFVITGAASQDTGASQVITVTAVGSSGSTFSSYAGDHALTFSGASAIGAYVPTCSDKTGADIPLGTATTLAFTDGIATCNLKLYKAENASIDATDGISSATGHTLAVTAVPQPASMQASVSDAAISAGVPITMGMTVNDVYGNVSTVYSGDHVLTFSGASSIGAYVPTASDKIGADIPFGSTTSVSFSSGIATSIIKLYKTGMADLSATDGAYATPALEVIVSPSSIAALEVQAPATIAAGIPFDLSLSAHDAYGNGANPTEDASLVLDHGTISPSLINPSSYQSFVGPDGNIYGYEKDISINNSSASDLTGYQVKLNLDTASIISAGKMQADCDDMRFAETDNSNIPYWIESGCNTSSTIVWIKTNLAASTSKDIYWYYGNGAVSSAANGNDVFDFFDDFSGSSLDSSKWTVTGTGTVTVGGGIMTARATSSAEHLVKSNSVFGANYALRSRLKSGAYGTNSSYEGFMFYGATGGVQAYYTQNQTNVHKYYSYSGANYSSADISGFTAGNYGVQEFIRNSTASVICRVDDASQVTFSTYVYAGSDSSVRFRNSNYGIMYSDWVLVRKYAPTEPTAVVGGSGSSIFAAGQYAGSVTITDTDSFTAVTLTAAIGAISDTMSIVVDGMDHFVISGSDTHLAGQGQTVTITAFGTAGSTFVYYTGDHALTFSGASAIGAYVPTCSDKTGADIPLGTATTLAFTDGIATCNLKLYKAENASIDATDGISAATGHTLGVSVYSEISSFMITSASTTTAGVPLSVTLSAKDTYGNDASTYSGDKNIIFTGAAAIGSYTPSATDKTGADVAFGAATLLEFDAGTATTVLKLFRSEAFTLGITDGSYSASAQIAVTPVDGNSSFAVNVPASTKSGAPFAVAITPRDAYGNLATDVSEPASITVNHGTINATAIPSSAFAAYAGPDGNVYSYRRAISITNNTASVLTGYQVRISLDTAALIASGKLQSSCADLRFSETDGADIPYWIESGCNTASTVIWIKTGLPASAAKTAYMFYGNDNVLSAADGDSVFAFFDDFSSADATKWSFPAGNYDITDGVLHVYSTNNGDKQATSLSAFGYDLIFRSSMKTAHSGVYSSLYERPLGMGTSTTEIFFGATDASSPAPRLYNYKPSAGTAVSVTGWSANAWYAGELKRTASSSMFSFSGGSFSNATNYPTDAEYLRIRAISSTAASAEVWTDWILGRQYVSVEPTVAVGEESEADGTYESEFIISGILQDTSVILTVQSGTVVGSATILVEALDHMNHFVITGSPALTAGDAQVITITATGESGDPFVIYEGDYAITFSGASAIGAFVPTCSDKTGDDIAFGTATTLAFTDGIATCNLKLYKAENASIDATDGTYTATGYALATAVSPALLDSFVITAPASAVSEAPFSMSITTTDAYGNTVAGLASDVTLSVSSGTISPSLLPATDFSGSLYTGNFTIAEVYADDDIAVSLDADGVSGSITIQVSGVDYMDHFILMGSATQIAGAAQSMTVSAIGRSGNVFAAYAGEHSLTFSGASLIGVNAPTASDKTGSAIIFGTSTALDFTDGIAHTEVRLYRAENAGLYVSDGVHSGTVYNVNVVPATLSYFDISAPTATVCKTPFAATLTAKDIYGNVTNQVANTTYATVDNGSISPSSLSHDYFADDGIYSGNFTITGVYADTTVTMTVANGAVSNTVSIAVTGVDDMHHFNITGQSTQIAGGSQTITITAAADSGATDATYVGEHSFVFSGASAIGAYAPTCSDKNGAAVAFGTATALNFTDGVATCNLKLYRSGSWSINASDGTYTATGHTLGVAVSAAPAVSFVVSAPSTVTSGAAFSMTVTAKDVYNNTTRDVDDNMAISVDQGSISPATLESSLFSGSGSYTGNFIISGISLDQTVTATFQSGVISQTKSFAVIGAEELHHFVLSGSSGQVAGQAQVLTITAINTAGDVDSSYEGSHSLTLAGASAIGAYIPSCDGIAFGTATALTFTEGVAACDLILYRAGTSNVNVSDGVHDATGHTLGVTVAAAAVAGFDVSTPTTAVAGTAFSVSFVALDTFGNLTTDVSADLTVAVDQGAITPASVAADSFAADGTCSKVFTISGILEVTDVAFLITDGTISETRTISVRQTDEMDHLRVTGPSGWVAGTVQRVTISAIGLSSNTFAAYSGEKTIIFSGANTIGAYIPDAEGVAFGSPVTLNFNDGIATADLRLYRAQTASISVSDGTYSADVAPLSTVVSPAPHSAFLIQTPISATAGTAFEMIITASDSYGNTVAALSNSTLLGVSQGTISPAAIQPEAFVAGVYTGNFTISSVLTDASITISFGCGSISAASTLPVIGTDEMHHFVISGPDSFTAGARQAITITAVGVSGSTFTAYAGSHNLLFSGADTIGTYVPLCTDQGGNDVLFGSPASLDFVGGVATCDLTLYRAGDAAISVTDGSHSVQSALAIAAVPAHIFSFAGSVPTVAVSDSPFILMLTAKDMYGNTTTDMDATTELSSDQGTVSPASISADTFIDGEFSGSIAISGIDADTTATLTVRNGSVVQTASLLVTGVDMVDHLSLAAESAAAVAGSALPVDVRLMTAAGETYTAFTGSRLITVSGASTIGGYVPSYTDRAGEHVVFQTSSVVYFNAGVASSNLFFYKAETVEVSASDAQHAGEATEFIITPAAFAAFSVTAPSSANIAEPFSLEVETLDQYGNITSDMDADVSLALGSGSLDTTSIPAASFQSGGSYIATVTIFGLSADTETILTVASGSVSQASPITVRVAASSASGGSIVFIPPRKPDISQTRISWDGGRIVISGIPETSSQFAISAADDFADASWQDIAAIDDILPSYSGASAVYLKFRTPRGGISDVLCFRLPAPEILLQDGDIVKTADSFDVYIIKLKHDKQYKRLILSPSVFASYQHLKWENLRIITPTEMNRYATSDLVQVAGDPAIYQLLPSGDTGQRWPFDVTVFHDPDSIYEINAVDRDSYVLAKQDVRTSVFRISPLLEYMRHGALLAH